MNFFFALSSFRSECGKVSNLFKFENFFPYYTSFTSASVRFSINLYFQMHALRRLMQGDAKHPKAPLGNNFRPPQPLHHRPVRTNIDFNVKHRGEVCIANSGQTRETYRQKLIFNKTAAPTTFPSAIRSWATLIFFISLQNNAVMHLHNATVDSGGNVLTFTCGLVCAFITSSIINLFC